MKIKLSSKVPNETVEKRLKPDIKKMEKALINS